MRFKEEIDNLKSDDDLKELANRLESYDNIDGHGNLKTYSKRKFKETKIPGASLWQQIATRLYNYYDDMSHEQKVKEDAEEWIARFCQPAIDIVKKEMALLSNATTPIGKKDSKRVHNKMKKLAQEFTDFEDELKAGLLPKHQDMIDRTYQGHGASTSKGAEPRLRLGLYETLGDFTNLTQADRIYHIAWLLIHFDIMDDTGDPEGSVSRTVLSKKRSQKERDNLEFKYLLENTNLINRMNDP